MCGICGELRMRPGDAAAAETVRAMARGMSHRGPDQEGFYLSRDRSLALGHRRLKIIDLSTGDQPMSNEDGSVVIAFNGEIYNFQGLRSELESQGHVFKTRSDTEVIIHLYEQEGIDGFARLSGMFAFAVFDEKRGRLVLARDQVGIKPLFYYADSRRLVFASELRALVRGIGSVPSLRDQAVFEYLLLQYVPGPETIFKGVLKLPPGGYLVADAAGVKTGKFFELRRKAPVERAGRRQAVEKIRSGIEASVRGQLAAEVPVGAFLSGGIDSSTIVALMKRIKGEGVKTFSVDFSALGSPAEVNETYWSKFAAEHFQSEHRQLRVSAEDAIGCFDTVVDRVDEPVADPACIPTYLISRLARGEVTVVLSGEGADELFGGYLRYRLERIGRLLGFLARPALLKLAGNLAGNFSNSLRLRKALRALSEKDAALRHVLWASVFSRERLSELLLRGNDFFPALAQRFGVCFSGSPDHLNNMLAADFGTWLADDLLVKVDRMSMAVSLEARVPFLDLGLIETVFALPGEWKIGLFSGKKILKDAVEGLVPEAIIRRKKAGFTLPLGQWFRSEMKELLTGQLSPGELKRAGIFDAAAVERLLSEHFSGRDDLSLQLYAILLLQMWTAKIKDWTR